MRGLFGICLVSAICGSVADLRWKRNNLIDPLVFQVTDRIPTTIEWSDTLNEDETTKFLIESELAILLNDAGVCTFDLTALFERCYDLTLVEFIESQPPTTTTSSSSPSTSPTGPTTTTPTSPTTTSPSEPSFADSGSDFELPSIATAVFKFTKKTDKANGDDNEKIVEEFQATMKETILAQCTEPENDGSGGGSDYHDDHDEPPSNYLNSCGYDGENFYYDYIVYTAYTVYDEFPFYLEPSTTTLPETSETPETSKTPETSETPDSLLQEYLFRRRNEPRPQADENELVAELKSIFCEGDWGIYSCDILITDNVEFDAEGSGESENSANRLASVETTIVDSDEKTFNQILATYREKLQSAEEKEFNLLRLKEHTYNPKIIVDTVLWADELILVIVESSLIGGLLLFSLICCACSGRCQRFGLTTFFAILFLAWTGILLFLGLRKEKADQILTEIRNDPTIWIIIGPLLGILVFVYIVFLVIVCCCTKEKHRVVSRGQKYGVSKL